MKNEKKKGLFVKSKEAISELKKVSWPSFSTLLKTTGVVLGVTLFFMIAVFGMDSLLGLLYNLLTKGLAT